MEVKLSGLNNLGMNGLQKPSAKPFSAKGAKASFEEALDQSKSGGSKADQASEQMIEGDALPMQPNAPVLNGPFNDRLVSGKPVVEPTLTAPGTKEKALLPQDEGIDSLTRRVVWNDFLRKMKDDLGVSAEDVLGAFASLTDEELAQPPQETLDTVVAALGLNAEQSRTAKAYFNDLVSKTKPTSMGEELGHSQRQINLTLMSQREAQRKSLNRSLDQLNSDFFMKNPSGPQATPLSKMEMIEVAAPDQLVVPGMAVSAPPESFPMAAAAPSLAPYSGAEPTVASMSALSEAPKPSSVPAKAKSEQKNTIDEMIRQFMLGEKPAAVAAGVPAAASSAPPVGAQQTADAAASAAIVGGIAGSLKGLLQDLSSSLDSEGDDEYSSDASYLTAGLASEPKIAGLNGPAPEFQAELMKAEKAPMSVPDLVNKAQIMVQGGGGEMKVVLTPEGMGEVAMKVSVNEGKVQVQMITESDEAKKMIERQLGELKSQLASNHLSLDTIKIDTATNLGKQLEQQYQDAQRQSMQTAWEQFRQDNQGWRRSFFETPSAKIYKGQGEAPRDVQAPSGVAASRKNINRRLDLVA